ncbi:MAG: response regulator [Oxalobacter sp.]|nr:MAG: response regulator [Oxalobacter sp.]
MGKDKDSADTLLNQAGAYLHQAHGALQIVDIDGAAVITECVEDILRRIISGDLHYQRTTLRAIEQAFQALVEYLEELIAGEPPKPIRLFPYYKDLQEIRKAERIHPADLFFTDLDTQGKHTPVDASVPEVSVDITRLRPRYERALLALLTSATSPAQTKGVDDLLNVVTDIEHTQSNLKLRDFWWVMHGFIDAVVNSQKPLPLFTKQVCGRMNRQIKLLAQGSSSISERLFLDALYCVAREESPSPLIEKICNAYQLRDLIPADFEQKRYGLIDTVTVGLAKTTLTQAKNTWYKVTQNEQGATNAFIQMVQQLIASCTKLNSPPLVDLLNAIQTASEPLRNTFPSRPLGLEVAADLLFMENALDHLSRIPEDFPQRVNSLIDRLKTIASGKTPGESAKWIDELTEQTQQRQTIGVLAAEMEGSLRQVEKLLNNFFNDPSTFASLSEIDPTLRKIVSVLSVLGAEDAMLGAEYTQQAIQKYKSALDAAGGYTNKVPFPDIVTQNITALSFFVEALHQHPETAKTRFAFDRNRGMLLANLLDKGVLRSETLTSADPSFDPLLDVENGAGLNAKPLHITRPAPKIPQTAPLPVTDEEIDAELLDIFMSEAEEVLAFVAHNLPAARVHASDQDQLATLRRSFHTLKGSGRMVGLNAFAEASYSVEQVMNLWLAEAKSGTPDLFALLEKSVDELGKWVADLRTHGRSSRTPVPLSNAANLVKTGHAFRYDESSQAPSADAAPPPQEPAPAVPANKKQQTQPSQAVIDPPVKQEEKNNQAALVVSDEPPKTLVAAPAAMAQTEQHAPNTNIIDFPIAPSPQASASENVKRIGHLEVSPQLFNIYVAEADVLLRTLSQDFSEWQHEPQRPASSRAIHAAHSLAGSSATVGLSSMQELAHTLEKYLHTQAQQPFKLSQTEFDVFQLCVDRFKTMMQAVTLGEFPSAQPDLVQLLRHLQQTLAATPSSPEEHIILTESIKIDDDFDLDAPETLTHDALVKESPPTIAVANTTSDAPLPRTVYAMEEDSPAHEVNDDDEGDEDDEDSAHRDHLDDELLPVFLEEGRDLLPSLGESLRGWIQDPADPSPVSDILRQLHTVKGSARMAGAMFLGHQFHLMETQIENILHGGGTTGGMLDELMSMHDYNLQLFDHLQNPQKKAPRPKRSTEPAAAQMPGAAEPLAASVLSDTAVSKAADAVPSPLPTAATPTAPIAPVAPPSLVSQPPAAPVIPTAPLAPIQPLAPVATTTPFTPAAPASSAPVARVRVRADILDRLVNQAGEVSIARSKIENEVDTLRQSLTDLTENLGRLRGQLREVEIQAESQITSRAQTTDREFDPLEFDRFSRLQELTRMMTESVDDVASIQDSLMHTVSGAVSDLETQAQLTRSLQQDLMQVRMVPFSSISERLYQIARQASKEMNKSVNLDVKGTSVEVDRGVLERMTGPLEHLLRNAIVHGIEAREERRKSGKNETGQLLVEIRQEGNEVAIQLSDDGMGLDLARIREKAISLGLVTKDRELTTAELENMIFQPGFTTASEVTSLAGRGVGLDVVRAEAASLGGRVNVQSEAGKGTRFTVHLPLTLAVTSVVLLQTGGTTYAVPSVLVEQVQQHTITALTAAYNEGAIMWQGTRVPLFFLSALLGDKTATPIAQQYTPTLILRSGTDRVAIHIDEVVGNREVVVKNIGPQLARMTGIVGATVLGSGNIVLIMDPVALGMRFAKDGVAGTQFAPSIPAPETAASARAKSVAKLIEPTHEENEPKTDDQLIQGLRKKNIVMVVDDSLTVRRVTQRFLQREGYQVVLAKDGVDALEKLQDVKPDVMLVDIEMPRMDGFDLIRNVRSDSRVSKTPIIMITSRTASKHRNYAMELGANEYYGKPFQEQQLLDSIEEFVGKDPSKETETTNG